MWTPVGVVPDVFENIVSIFHSIKREYFRVIKMCQKLLTFNVK